MASNKKELEEQLIRAAEEGRTEEVIALLDMGVDIEAPDKDGNIALICASVRGKEECVKVLLERGAQVNRQDWYSRTALICASVGGKEECVRILLQRGAQVNMQDEVGRPALIYASGVGEVECVRILLDSRAQANIQDNFGRTALYCASERGEVDCARVLLEKGAQANIQNKDGNTALHKAAERGRLDCVNLLLSTPGIEVNIKNSKHCTPLMLARDYGVLTTLQKYTTSCEDFPVHNFAKVILCGNTGAGKTTLAQVIIYLSEPEVMGESRFYEPVAKKIKLHDATHPGPVNLLTAGIVPHVIKSSRANMMLFDLAGHHGYYSSHCAVLESISVSPSTFLLLVNLLLGLKDIIAQVYYWLAMISDVCHKCPLQSSVIVVGTHVDGIAGRTQLECLGRGIEKVARVTIEKTNKHTFIGFIALNGTAPNGEEVKGFMSLLHETTEGVNARCPAISLSNHVAYAFLNDKVPVYLDAIPLSHLLTLLGQEELKVLPTEASEIIPHLKTLSDKGFIVFLESSTGDSWIVVRPEALLEKVNGVLFAPKEFKEYLPIASNTGVIPVAVLKQHFPEPTYKIDMIVQFLKLFELCVPITLTKVDTNLTPRSSPNTPSTDLGPFLFFPACVSVEMPPNVTIPQRGFGWLICTGGINEFFSSRCRHVLTSRLADCFALPTAAQHSIIPELDMYNRRCDVWSKGVMWMNEEGMTTVVEMKDDFRCLSCTISTSNVNSPTYLQSVIKVIKETCSEFCPSVSLVELITCPPEATSDHTPATVELHLLKKIIQNKGNSLTDSLGRKKVIINEWEKVEPLLLNLIGIAKSAQPMDNATKVCPPLLFNGTHLTDRSIMQQECHCPGQCGAPLQPLHCPDTAFEATPTVPHMEASSNVHAGIAKSVFILYCKEQGSPSKEQGSPSKEQGSPSREQGSPSKEQGSPSKEQGSPSKEQGSPSKEQGSPSRKDILNLADLLHQYGISCTCDIYLEAEPPHNWSVWTSEQIHKSDHTLLVCSRLMLSICAQMPKHQLFHMNCGCFYDSAVVNCVDPKKFIPVFLNQPTNKDWVPENLKTASQYELQVNQLILESSHGSKQLEELLNGGKYIGLTSLLKRLLNVPQSSLHVPIHKD